MGHKCQNIKITKYNCKKCNKSKIILPLFYSNTILIQIKLVYPKKTEDFPPGG